MPMINKKTVLYHSFPLNLKCKNSGKNSIIDVKSKNEAAKVCTIGITNWFIISNEFSGKLNLTAEPMMIKGIKNIVDNILLRTAFQRVMPISI